MSCLITWMIHLEILDKDMAEKKEKEKKKGESGVKSDSNYCFGEIDGDDIYFKSKEFTVLGKRKKRSLRFPI